MIEKACAFIRERISDFTPEFCLVLGSGCGTVAEQIDACAEIPYRDIPGFHPSTAPGHSGRLIFGRLAGRRVVCMQGRLHHYEGYSMAEIVFPIRVLRHLGAQFLILTNASGGINVRWQPGDIMAVTDHINFMGDNPLIGPNRSEEGVRFPDMTHAYDRELLTAADSAANALGIELRHGVYLATSGPSFETPAEICAFRTLGADAVGMSTVPEVIQAAHCGFRTLVFSLITNMAAGVLDRPITAEEVGEIGTASAGKLGRLIEKTIEIVR